MKTFGPINFKTRFPALDGLRGVAILMVFANHFGGGSHGGRVLQMVNAVRTQGWMGVNLFFALSGFLITGVLYDTRSDTHYAKRFFVRRSLRVFPVVYLVFAVLLLLTPPLHYQWRWQQATFLVYLGDIFSNYDPTLVVLPSATHPGAKVFLGHFWSLCVEEQFYVVWPLAVWWVRDRRRLLWMAGGLSVLALLLRGVMVITTSPEMSERWIFRTLPFQMDSLLAGAMLALLLRGPRADAWVRRCRWIFAGAVVLVSLEFWLSPSSFSPWLFTVGLTLIAVASAGLVGMALLPGSVVYRALHLSPLRRLGRYSYGFYIYHVLYGWAWIQFLIFVTAKVHSVVLGGLIALPLNFLVTYGISVASYNLFERRFLVLKRGFEYDSERSEHRHAFRT